MNCRVCRGDDLYPLWPDAEPPQAGGNWFRCLLCGSDSNAEPRSDIYTGEYLINEVRMTGGPEARERYVVSNVEWFQAHRSLCPDDTFLDVGCLDGAMLRFMGRQGWATHGFDIIPEAKMASPPGDHVTVAPEFRESLFPRTFSAVMCREVIEHVDGWESFFDELVSVVRPGGLLQLQTPRPSQWPHPCPYQSAHFLVFAPESLKLHAERRGLAIVDRWLWPAGQALMCQKPTSP